jgi:hypothetical protein
MTDAITTVLAFDIGVKNLAYALIREDRTVLSLENVNLLPPVTPLHCEHPTGCTHLAKYRTPSAVFCKRHLPKTHTILPELDKKKSPPHRRLKELVQEHELKEVLKGATSEAYLQALHTRFALPVHQPTQDKVASLSLSSIHDALRNFTQTRWDTLRHATHVLLENQPAFKNPHMKSVQVLLFATLREQFLRDRPPTLPPPPFHLVHAKKKVGDAPKGDAGYAERKHKSEERVRQLFEQGLLHGTAHYENWKLAKKKSDMADALCMAEDYLVERVV